jgi:hypothetical protein
MQFWVQEMIRIVPILMYDIDSLSYLKQMIHNLT